MYFEDDVISSESGSQDPNGATEELASQSSSCDQPIGSGSTPRCNLFEDDFAGSSEASDQESTRTRDDSHNESEGGHSSNQGQDDEGGHSDQDEGQDHEGGPSAEAAQDATPRPLGRGKYSREGTCKKLSFDLQREVALHDDTIDEVMLCKCNCGANCTGRFSPNLIKQCRSLRYKCGGGVCMQRVVHTTSDACSEWHMQQVEHAASGAADSCYLMCGVVGP